MDYILYHHVKPGHPCPDGVAAAWVAHLNYPSATVLGAAYGYPVPIEPLGGDRLIIVDFSFPSAQLQDWARRGVDIILIDHHKTALNDLAGFSASLSGCTSYGTTGEGRISEHIKLGNTSIRLLFDMQECGATLAWKELFPQTRIPGFLRFVRSRDLWLDCDLFADPIPPTLIVHEAISSLKNEICKEFGREHGAFILFDSLAWMGEAELLAFASPLGIPLVEEKRQQVRAIASRWELGQLPGLAEKGQFFDIPIVELASDGSEDRFKSDVGNYICKSVPTAPFCAIVNSDGSYDLRSSRDGSNFDVSAIAKLLGGGGHHNASAFRAKPDFTQG
jgi:hypothetical protein